MSLETAIAWLAIRGPGPWSIYIRCGNGVDILEMWAVSANENYGALVGKWVKWTR